MCQKAWKEKKMKKQNNSKSGKIGVGGIITLAIVGILALSFVGTYNGLQRQDEGVTGAWKQVENQLKRRYDMIPQLVSVVKGYASHEKDTLTAVVEARSKVSNIKVTPEMLSDPAMMKKFTQAQAGLSGALSKLMVVVEKYPDLKANESFMGLQDEIAGTENRLATERKRYNDKVEGFNARIRTLWSNFVAGIAGLEKRVYFELDEGELEAVKQAPTIEF
jgi:LemA protein